MAMPQLDLPRRLEELPEVSFWPILCSSQLAPYISCSSIQTQTKSFERALELSQVRQRVHNQLGYKYKLQHQLFDCVSRSRRHLFHFLKHTGVTFLLRVERFRSRHLWSQIRISFWLRTFPQQLLPHCMVQVLSWPKQEIWTMENIRPIVCCCAVSTVLA